MFEKHLEKKGWIKREDVRHLQLTEDELMEILTRHTDDVDVYDTSIDREAENAIFQQLADIPDLQEYLKGTLARDIRRFFEAQGPVQQAEIRGAFKRTVWLRKKITTKDQNKPKGLKISREL